MKEIILVGIPSIFSGALLFFFKYYFSRFEKKAEERAQARQKETNLILINLDAVGGMSRKIAVCVKNNRVNGDMEEALDYYDQQRHQLKDFLREQGVKATHE